MTKVGIINVTGYAGSELARILRNHPEVTIASVTGRSAAGQRLPEAVPHLWDIDLPITTTVEESVDFVFSSLPSGASAEALAPLVDGGVKAVDIAADFRIRSAEGFKAAYKIDHPAPHLLEQAVYGLPEINRSRIGWSVADSQSGLLPGGVHPGVGAGGPDGTYRAGRHHRRQVGGVRRGTWQHHFQPDVPLRRVQRERAGLRAGGPRTPAGDSPGAGVAGRRQIPRR